MGTKARSSRLLSRVFTDALQYAAELHADQKRNGPDRIPYVAHLLGVASLVLEHGGDETQAIAALLHDALEDRPRHGRTEREIADRFGPDVLRLVRACTDSTSPDEPRDASTWQTRKVGYLAHIARMRNDERLVSMADKLHNARAILADQRRVGDAVWSRFKVGKDLTLGYYRSLVRAYVTVSRHPAEHRLLAKELERTVDEMERLAGRR